MNSQAPSFTPSRRLDTGAFLHRQGPGLLLCALITAAAMGGAESDLTQQLGLSALTLAIVLGMVLGNTVYPSLGSACGPGVHTAKQSLLRLGIVLYGLRLTLQDVSQVGLAGVLVDALVLASTFGLACLIGMRWLGLERNTAMLVGAGSAICGAAAVMATEPVLRARAEQVTVAVATVVLFGTLATFAYPLFFQWNLVWHWVAGGPAAFGVYTGATVHEVAQVVAASRGMGAEAANAAVIAKMVRVMLLAPFLMLLSAALARSSAQRSPDGGRTRLTIPWFAFGFLAVVLLHSFVALPPAWLQHLTQLDNALLAMAMAALGLSTHARVIRQAGLRPLLLAALLWVWLIGGGALIQRLVQSLG